MNTEIDVRVSVDLHPQIIDNLDGVDADTSTFVSGAVECFDAAYKFIGAVHDMRNAAFADPTLTPEAALLKTDDYANSKLTAVTKMLDGTSKRFTTTINALQKDLTAGVKEEGSKMVSGEIRAHIKAAGPDRIKLLEQALVDKDTEVLSAVCGASPMLSAITKEMHQFFTLRYNELVKPETAKRLKALIAARDHIDNRGPLVLREMLKAVGTVPVIQKDKAGISRIVGHVKAHEVRAKRNASAEVYRKLA
ncbi:hypothetical protein EF888_19975 [Silicimonas algicola]|uniref:Uncharacterized protein n=1 Tax=Silicimonas algicola TaxID=1826607 RepID=A0A316G4Y1_9RHOB|nr:hypothetical protein [Silicimonas algicola]AZQ69210.1 hypothetical protein EF888_19975 [Silicimonas algicola]PWK54976.1 hypothetical protein C8D95_10963 [Silicimonas algicola]